MRTTSLLSAFPKSFYSKELYKEVGREWPGLGFGYLLTVICIISLPLILFGLFYTTTITLDKPFDANYIINQIPEMTIKNGEISTKVTMPYYIKDKETGYALAVIDTTRPVADWSQQTDKDKVFVIVGKNQVLTKNSQRGESRLYDIPKDANMAVNSDIAREYANKMLGYSWIGVLFSAPFVILTWFLFRILVMFLYGILGKILSLITSVSLTYIDCVRLASVATTPTLVLFCASALLSIDLAWFTFFAVNAVYLFCAVRANKNYGF